MWYNGTFRLIEERPFFGTDGGEIGLFSDGFHFGCFVDGQWVSIERVMLVSSWVEDTGELKMKWVPEKDYGPVE